jgi:hypothetical protein
MRYDRTFVSWEIAKEFPNLMRDILKQERAESSDVRLIQLTIVSPSDSICESPLPTLWQSESSQYGELL